MGAAAGAAALGIGIGVVWTGRAPDWWDADALIDFDAQHGRYRFNGTTYPSLAEFLAAIGGTAIDTAIVVGPHATGNFAYQSDFSLGVDGWADSPGEEADGEASASGGALVLTTVAPYRAHRTVAVDRRRAYRGRVRRLSATTSSQSLNVGGSNAGNSNSSVSVQLAANGVSYNAIAQSGASSVSLVLVTSGAGVLTVDALSLEEVQPYVGWTLGQFSFDLEVTFPGTLAATQVLIQWGQGDEDNRTRLDVDAAGNVTLRSTLNTSEGAAVLLGTVAPGSTHRFRGSVADDAIYGNMDGGPVQVDTSVGIGAYGMLWIGRSFTGEAFAGTIRRLRVYPTTADNPDDLIDADRGFIAYGDSRSAGARASDAAHAWYNLLAASMDVAARPKGVGGDSFAATLAIVEGYTVNRGRPTIITQYRNTGEVLATALQQLREMISLIGHQRIYIEPMWPAVAPATETMQAFVDGYNAALLDEFAAFSLDAADQAAFLAASLARTGGDGTHGEDDMQAIQAGYAELFLTAKGWFR